MDSVNALLDSSAKSTNAIRQSINNSADSLAAFNGKLAHGIDSSIVNVANRVGDVNNTAQQIKNELDFNYTSNGGASFSSIRSLFDQSAINSMKSKQATLKTDINNYINQIKTESSNMFSLSELSGSFNSDTSVNLSYGEYKLDWEDKFRSVFPYLSTAFIALAWLIAMSVLLGD